MKKVLKVKNHHLKVTVHENQALTTGILSFLVITKIQKAIIDRIQVLVIIVSTISLNIFIGSMSTVAQDPPSTVVKTQREKPSILLSLHRSIKKKSIEDRLDTTENLLKKINVDIGKIKNKAKYTHKVKNLIQKIIMSRSNGKESNDDTSGCESGDSNTTFKMTGDSKGTQKANQKDRYDRIDEESSYVGSDNVSSFNEITEGIKINGEEMREQKEIPKYGLSNEKNYHKKRKETRELIRESAIKFDKTPDTSQSFSHN